MLFRSLKCEKNQNTFKSQATKKAKSAKLLHLLEWCKWGQGVNGVSVQKLTVCRSIAILQRFCEELLQLGRKLDLSFSRVHPAQLLADIRRATHREDMVGCMRD